MRRGIDCDVEQSRGRKRTCTNPKPSCEGAACKGSDSEKEGRVAAGNNCCADSDGKPGSYWNTGSTVRWANYPMCFLSYAVWHAMQVENPFCHSISDLSINPAPAPPFSGLVQTCVECRDFCETGLTEMTDCGDAKEDGSTFNRVCEDITAPVITLSGDDPTVSVVHVQANESTRAIDRARRR